MINSTITNPRLLDTAEHSTPQIDGHMSEVEKSYICVTCGTQYESAIKPPKNCPICEDERQFVNWNGQEWTTLADLQRSHQNLLTPQGPGIIGVGTTPKFAIGQRALLVQTKQGNLLWDCISLIDEATAEAVRALGGISAIAISHPHYYSSMAKWSEIFGNVPIYIHADDQAWVMHASQNIVFWKGEEERLFGNLTLIRCGGHFEGGTVLHWVDGEQGAGALLTGDIIQVAQDRRFVSFMWSYPNYIPLPRSAVNRIVASIRRFDFKRIYGAWWDAIVESDAKAAVEKSAVRYLNAISDAM